MDLKTFRMKKKSQMPKLLGLESEQKCFNLKNIDEEIDKPTQSII